MLKILGDTIQLTRGDTAWLDVCITNDVSGTEYIPEEGDTLTITLKSSVYDVVALLSKTVPVGSGFMLSPADTANLSFKTYKYDIQLTTANGDVYTVIGPASFDVLPEVTT